jgi:hypothetical protein
MAVPPYRLLSDKDSGRIGAVNRQAAVISQCKPNNPHSATDASKRGAHALSLP